MTGLEVRIAQDGPIPLDAAFSCGPGETLALVGPSGSGKSTILRSIAGTYQPASGRIVAGGDIWFDAAAGVAVKPHLRRAGLVFQDYALFPHMTAVGNLTVSMGHVPKARRREMAARLLDMVHLTDLENRYPDELSGGQQQRVAVARALAREPDVLLLDEPFSAVDRATRQRLYREISELRQSLEIPVVLVTHDMDEAVMLADRMAVLHRGAVLQTGAPEELTNRPATPQIARLVGLGNVFEGRIEGHDAAAGHTVLSWRGQMLEVALRRDLVVGTVVDWVVPEGFVVLHRRGRPSLGERENPVRGVITSLLFQGQTAQVVMTPEVDPERQFRFSLPAHSARRNGLAQGEEVTVSLIAGGVHVMG